MNKWLRRTCLGVGLCLLAAASVMAQNWKSAESLPSVDFSHLTPAQKVTALKILREQGCSCGCNMKIAECRVVDPSCSYSTGLAGAVVQGLSQGKSESDVIASLRPKLLEDPVTIPVAGAPYTGPQNAPITIVEFSDFQCPYCKAAIPELSAILQAFPSQVKLIFKEYPLETHSHADLAAAAAVSAHKQGKFWQLHDAMFASKEDLTRDNILKLAQEKGLDVKRLAEDLDSTGVRETVVRDVQDGDHAGVQGTPTIFINGQRYNGPINMASLKTILDADLKLASGQTSSVRVHVAQ